MHAHWKFNTVRPGDRSAILAIGNKNKKGVKSDFLAFFRAKKVSTKEGSSRVGMRVFMATSRILTIFNSPNSRQKIEGVEGETSRIFSEN